MASKDRGAPSDIKKDLLKEGHRFSFFQVIRLLRLFDSEPFDVHRQEPFRSEQIKIRPDLSLAFPAADVANVENLSNETADFEITATFLGLYGSSSPLPTFYSEDLLDEAIAAESVTRDFIDIVNARIFSLFFRCWTKYRQFIKVAEENTPRAIDRLFCLLGLGEKELREEALEPYRLIRYLGLFTQFPRSALGLKTLLQDGLGGVDVELNPCVNRRAKIPSDQRPILGTPTCSLGEECFLGEEIEDRMGKFRLQMGPLTREQFDSLLPGKPNHRWLTFLIQFYLTDSLEYDLELILADGEVQTACLGALDWSRLGLDTWIFSGDFPGDVRTIFHPQKS
jgi:type VI secretion system protein ImpH